MKRILTVLAIVLFTINLSAQEAKPLEKEATEKKCCAKKEDTKCKADGKKCSAKEMKKSKANGKKC
jgi:hypothetical protein